MLDKLFYADKITRSSTLRKVEWLKVLEKPIQTHSSKEGRPRSHFHTLLEKCERKRLKTFSWLFPILRFGKWLAARFLTNDTTIILVLKFNYP